MAAVERAVIVLAVMVLAVAVAAAFAAPMVAEWVVRVALEVLG